ncbi:SCO4225 family membrane protein [Streptomyces sp. DT224]|uniref:SCO4225 family membrane protein n=1 Tax=Streptomyces sp. DT224 TaxID=3393426 RepID=UPI003CF2C095
MVLAAGGPDHGGGAGRCGGGPGLRRPQGGARLTFIAHEDAPFAGVRLFLPAAPTVFAFLLGSSAAGAESFGPAWFMYLALTVTVLVQSPALARFVQLVRGAARRNRTIRPEGA